MEVRYFEFDAATEPQSLVFSKGPPAEPAIDAKAPRAPPVKFLPPGGTADDELQYEFVMAQPNLGLRMERVVREVFALYGNGGLGQLRIALQPPPAGASMSAGGEPVEPESEHGLALRTEFEDKCAALTRQLEPALAIIRGKAVEIALERVKASQLVVDNERKRYLGVGASLFDHNSKLALIGPEVDGLVRTLIEVDVRSRELKAAERWLESAKRTQRMDELGMYRALPKIDMGRRPVRRPRRGNPLEPPLLGSSSPVAQPHQHLTEVHSVFVAWLASTLKHYPVLYRIWNASDLAAEIAEIRRMTARIRDPAQRPDAMADFLKRSPVLVNQVADSLRTISQASGNVRERIEQHKDDFDAWRYAPLVNEAMEQLGVPVPTIEWRAANERIASARSCWISDLNTAVGLIEDGAAFLGASPPVALATRVISFLVSGIDWLVQKWKDEEDNDAFNSSLDPAQSFAAQPSATWSIVGLACLVLQGSGLGGMAR